MKDDKAMPDHAVHLDQTQTKNGVTYAQQAAFDGFRT